jgi:hypothetical protein
MGAEILPRSASDGLTEWETTAIAHAAEGEVLCSLLRDFPPVRCYR